MQQAGINPSERPVIKAALDKEALTNGPAVAIQLTNGQIITGKTSSLLGASSAALINALKVLANIPDQIDLISPVYIKPIQALKVGHLKNKNPLLHIDELLIALTIASTRNENAKNALECLHLLNGAEAHSSVILSQIDQNNMKKLGIRLSCEPKYQTKQLYHPK